MNLSELVISIIRPQVASVINKQIHSRLPDIDWSNIVRNRYYVCYGIRYAGKYIAVAIWSSPVNQNFPIESTLELRRLAISSDCPKNTATWMIAKNIKDITNRFPLVSRLISYQDTEVHKGTIYKAANWHIGGETKFVTWGGSRKRNKDQSTANKVRWEYEIKRRKINIPQQRIEFSEE